MANEIRTKLVRIERNIVEDVEKYCSPTGASVGKYFATVAKAQLIKDKVRNADKIGGKKK